MNRRAFLTTALAIGVSVCTSRAEDAESKKGRPVVEKIKKSEDQWRKELTLEQFDVLREEGTERPFTSPLNDEKRKGVFVCAACALDLFTSDMKYNSGTGWPSFFRVIEGHVEAKTDFKLLLPRTEYHCARCGGHQGHVFKDCPPPTGLRYCNNGVALRFVPEK